MSGEEVEVSTPEAGWYADTVDPTVVRWWDGERWSDQTQPNPAAQPAMTPNPVASAPFVPPPFADPQPEQKAGRRSAAAPVAGGSSTPAPSVPAAVAPPTAAPLDFPPPAFASPEFAAPAATAAPGSKVGSKRRSSVRSAATPGSRRAGASPPSSEPVRGTPPASDSISVLGFPDFDDPMAMAKPATATPMPTSVSAPWTSSTTFAQPSSSAELASVDYEPMSRTGGSGRTSRAVRPITGVTTSGAWMLAISPVLHLGLAALGWWLTEGGASSITLYVGAGLGAAAVLWVLIGAIADYRRLGTLGHEFRPSVLWILLGPFFYLLVRAVHVFRTTRSGTGPTWVFVVSALLVGAALSGGSLLLARDASLAELRGVETAVASELQEQGLDYTVLCPSETSGTPGSSFVCTAYDEVGPAALIRVTWTGLNGSFVYTVESAAASS